ncbi:GNAT family N-acetyltransferase [Pinirhizobacter soli]|uniref:GNAT family N-acetyltransferase n=1 Tax=Pinirhizobacter soli TaxID=2786953 RepID=UPI00202AAA91|nr:GNAT family N-acetyltransferase [Pinirhizobacter soli]
MKDETPLTYRNSVPSDAKSLPPMARRIFVETFAHLFEPTAFAAFCDSAYGENGSMVQDLGDARILWRIAEAEGKPIGYAKLRPLAAPAPNAALGALELQQIYVAAEWHGKGVARELLDWSVSAARQLGATELYLTVFDQNERAKAFYGKHGFSEVGRCTFTLGGRDYDDRVWLKPL